MLHSVLQVAFCTLELTIVFSRLQYFYNLEELVGCGHSAHGALWIKRPCSSLQLQVERGVTRGRVPVPASGLTPASLTGEVAKRRRCFGTLSLLVFDPVIQAVFLFNPGPFQL